MDSNKLYQLTSEEAMKRCIEIIFGPYLDKKAFIEMRNEFRRDTLEKLRSY